MLNLRDAQRFVARMTPPQTERELIAGELLQRARGPHARGQERTR